MFAATENTPTPPTERMGKVSESSPENIEKGLPSSEDL